MTGGQVHDSQAVEEVLGTPNPPLAATADKAYDSQDVRRQITDEGALPVIPSRSTATRYDRLARNFLAANALVGALYWIKL